MPTHQIGARHPRANGGWPVVTRWAATHIKLLHDGEEDGKQKKKKADHLHGIHELKGRDWETAAKRVSTEAIASGRSRQAHQLEHYDLLR
jgi:hypothetical protein